jgi:hypothetical protein
MVIREAKDGVQRALRDALGLGSGGKRRLVDGLIKVDMEVNPVLASMSGNRMKKFSGEI